MLPVSEAPLEFSTPYQNKPGHLMAMGFMLVIIGAFAALSLTFIHYPHSTIIPLGVVSGTFCIVGSGIAGKGYRLIKKEDEESKPEESQPVLGIAGGGLPPQQNSEEIDE